MNSLYYWRYSLKSRSSLNAVSPRREFEGALIRRGAGFGCIHPWPELGDASLDEQLGCLERGEESYTPLIRGAMECARMDGEARARGASVFLNPIPASHWLIREGDSPEFARSEGFVLAKLKGSNDFEQVRSEMRKWIDAGFRIRLDFNECLPVAGFLPFWQSLAEGEQKAVDVVEDPERWTESGWMDLRYAGVPIAVDRDHSARLRKNDTLVYKPARLGWACNRETKFYVTSNMDHAIGQMYAAAFAASIGQEGENENLLPCGLLTHRCFEDDEFFEQIQTDGPRLLAPGGTGLGFDGLLENLPWKRLT